MINFKFQIALSSQTIKMMNNCKLALLLILIPSCLFRFFSLLSLLVALSTSIPISNQPIDIPISNDGIILLAKQNGFQGQRDGNQFGDLLVTRE